MTMMMILSLGSVHFLFAVLVCGIVFLLRFVIATVIQTCTQVTFI